MDAVVLNEGKGPFMFKHQAFMYLQHVQKRDANFQLAKRATRQGIICECCQNQCSLSELQEYCAIKRQGGHGRKPSKRRIAYGQGDRSKSSPYQKQRQYHHRESSTVELTTVSQTTEPTTVTKPDNSKELTLRIGVTQPKKRSNEEKIQDSYSLGTNKDRPNNKTSKPKHTPFSDKQLGTLLRSLIRVQEEASGEV